MIVFRIHPPTGIAWLCSGSLFFFSMEFWLTLSKIPVLYLFDEPYSQSEMLPLYITCYLSTFCSIAYLIKLYIAPNRLCINPNDGSMIREYTPFFRPLHTGGQLADWQIDILFFRRKEQEAKIFKVLVIHFKDYKETIVPADMHETKVSQLVDCLYTQEKNFGAFRTEIEQESAGAPH